MRSAALASYRASLTIRERLAKADAGNAERQRNLSVSHNKIGDVVLAQGDLASALKSYRASQTIMERLTLADPGNAAWQQNCSSRVQKSAMRSSHSVTGRRPSHPIKPALPLCSA